MEFELQQVGTHISHKIYELNKVSRKKTFVHNHSDVIEGNKKIYKLINI